MKISDEASDSLGVKIEENITDQLYDLRSRNIEPETIVLSPMTWRYLREHLEESLIFYKNKEKKNELDINIARFRGVGVRVTDDKEGIYIEVH